MLLLPFRWHQLRVDDAQPRGLAKPREPFVPGAAWPIERPVIETDRKPPGEPLDHRAEIPAKAAQRVLCLDAHAGQHRLAVGAHIGRTGQLHQGVRLVPRQGEGPPRAVVFERPAERELSIGSQRAGDGVALLCRNDPAFEVERQVAFGPDPGAGLAADAPPALHPGAPFVPAIASGGKVLTISLLRVSRSARNQ